MVAITFHQAARVASLFAQAVSAGQATLAASLFHREAVLTCPDQGGVYRGRGQIEAYLRARTETQAPTLHCLNSPAFRAERQEGSYFLNSFQLRSEEPGTYIHFGERLDIRFQEEKILHMCWREMLSLLPSRSAGCDLSAWTQPLPVGPALSETEVDGVLQCIGRHCHGGAHETPARLYMLCAPVLSAGGADGEAEALYLALLHEQAADGTLHSQAARLRFHLRRADGAWHIRQIDRQTLLDMGAQAPTPFAPPQAADMARAYRALPLPEPGRAPTAGESAAIQTAAAHWVAAIRSCDPSYFYAHCLAVDHPQLHFHVAAPERGLPGFLTQCRLMREMDLKQPKKQGSHSLCTPYLIQTDDDHALGWWFDYGWTLMAEAFGVTACPYPALPDIGRYILHLEKCGGAWKVYDFRWGPLFQHGVSSFDPARSRGWAGRPDRRRWPLLFTPDSPESADDFAVDPMARFGLPTDT